MKLNCFTKASNESTVANITLGKDELKLIGSMCREFMKQTPKIMENYITLSRLRTMYNICAKIVKDGWDESISKWRDPSYHSKSKSFKK